MFNLKLKGLSEPQLLFDFKLCAFGTQEVRLRAATLFFGCGAGGGGITNSRSLRVAGIGVVW